jgi:hypothetical protein
MILAAFLGTGPPLVQTHAEVRSLQMGFNGLCQHGGEALSLQLRHAGTSKGQSWALTAVVFNGGTATSTSLPDFGFGVNCFLLASDRDDSRSGKTFQDNSNNRKLGVAVILSTSVREERNAAKHPPVHQRRWNPQGNPKPIRAVPPLGVPRPPLFLGHFLLAAQGRWVPSVAVFGRARCRVRSHTWEGPCRRTSDGS